MLEIHHALVLDMHQPSGNLQELLDTQEKEWEAKEILFAYDRMARILRDNADLARVNASFSGTSAVQPRLPDARARHRQMRSLAPRATRIAKGPRSGDSRHRLLSPAVRFFDTLPAERRDTPTVTVERGAWNTEEHHGFDFTQWQGSQAQRDAMDRLHAVSAAFHGRASSLDPDTREQAQWRILRAETGCNFFWGDAWLPRAHADLDQAADLLGISRDGLPSASDRIQPPLTESAATPISVVEPVVYLTRPEPVEDQRELMAARLTDAGIANLADLAALSRDDLVARLGPDVDAASVDALLRTSRNLQLIAYNQAVGSGFDASDERCVCNDCDAAVSPASYLADLIAYTVDHVERSGASITVEDLGSILTQPLTRLTASCSAVETPISQVRLCIEVLRKRSMRRKSRKRG